VTIKHIGDWILFDSSFGVKVKIGLGIISVTVGPDQLDNTRGLCGTYNGHVNDEFTDTKGRLAIRADLFATSWRVDEICQEAAIPLNRGQCASNSEVEEKARRKCQVIFMKPFRYIMLTLYLNDDRYLK